MNDLKFGFRILIKRPGTSLLAIVALGLGIGLTTTMFSIVQGVFLRGLPFEESERILAISRHVVNRPANSISTSLEDFLDWRASQQTFEELSAFAGDTVVVSGGLAPQEYRAADITANSLHLLRTTTALGRDFTDADSQPGAPAVAIISEPVWRLQFGGDPGVIGRSIRVNGTPTEIVGVMPPKFAFPQGADLWRPLELKAGATRGQGRQVSVVGRLKAGVTIERASADMAAIARRLEQQYPENKDLTTDVMPFIRRFMSKQVISTLTAMLVAVMGVLLIACANVTNLQLARAAERGKEIAVRTALGAGRARVVRQLLVEGLILAALGAALGLGIALVGTRLFRGAVADTHPPFWIDIRVDQIVLLFVMAITLLAAVLSSLVPALRVTRQDVNAVLKDEGRGNTGVRIGRFSRTLVVAEVLLSCCLLVVSGLVIKSVVQIGQVDYPFATEDVFTGSVLIGQKAYPADADVWGVTDRLADRLASVPGVRGLAFSSGVPTPGGGTPASVEGRTYASDNDHPMVRRVIVSPSFFATLRVPLLRGRMISVSDGAAAPPVALVGEDFARKLFPGEDAVGRRVKYGNDPKAPWVTIIGIVPNLAVGANPGDVTETMYVPLAQFPVRTLGILASTTGDPVALTSAIRRAIADVDQDLALSGSDRLSAALWQRSWAFRVFGALLTAFGVGALVLAAAGLYGVMAFGVRRRTQEIGVRLALGADRARVIRMVLSQGLWRVGAGIALGLLPAWFLAGFMKILFFNVTQGDPVVFGVVIGVLLLTGFAASIVPALRAASVDPIVALRHE
ncbi:MAG TPA: ABC transporter permease [Vicinamibacterales bacterium]|nr:ABC transporter permease [Vicinamibacterales bacterium]